MTFWEFANNHTLPVIFGSVVISLAAIIAIVIIIALLCEFFERRGRQE